MNKTLLWGILLFSSLLLTACPAKEPKKPAESADQKPDANGEAKKGDEKPAEDKAAKPADAKPADDKAAKPADEKAAKPADSKAAPGKAEKPSVDKADPMASVDVPAFLAPDSQDASRERWFQCGDGNKNTWLIQENVSPEGSNFLGFYRNQDTESADRAGHCLVKGGANATGLDCWSGKNSVSLSFQGEGVALKASGKLKKATKTSPVTCSVSPYFKSGVWSAQRQLSSCVSGDTTLWVQFPVFNNAAEYEALLIGPEGSTAPIAMFTENEIGAPIEQIKLHKEFSFAEDKKFLVDGAIHSTSKGPEFKGKFGDAEKTISCKSMVPPTPILKSTCAPLNNPCPVEPVALAKCTTDLKILDPASLPADKSSLAGQTISLKGALYHDSVCNSFQCDKESTCCDRCSGPMTLDLVDQKIHFELQNTSKPDLFRCAGDHKDNVCCGSVLDLGVATGVVEVSGEKLILKNASVCTQRDIK